jgi:hypothetical protein
VCMSVCAGKGVIFLNFNSATTVHVPLVCCLIMYSVTLYTGLFDLVLLKIR